MRRENHRIRVQVLRNQAVLAETCKEAVSSLDRFLGLMGRTHLPQGEGLWIPHCRSIHMWFMRMAIDAVFVKPTAQRDRYIVVKRYAGLRPWRLLPVTIMGARDVVELPPGTIARCDLREGDELCISSPSSLDPTAAPATS